VFLRRIFGERKEVPRQQISLEALRSELVGLRESRLRSCEEDLRRIVAEIVSCRDGLLRSIDSLCGARPSADVHSGLLKAGESARRLLSEKLRRALAELRPPSDFSASGLGDFNARLAKSINLTTDAMVAHGRYVRAVFERECRDVVMGLEEIQRLSREMHEAGQRVLQDVERIESLIREIDSALSLRSSMLQESGRVGEMEARASSLDSRISEERKKLEELRSSEQYTVEAGMRREEGIVEEELRKFRNEVCARFSEVSRPLKKVRKLVEEGAHGMEKEKVRVLGICMEDPLHLFSDSSLLSCAAEVLGEVARLIEERKVELEERERKKKLEKVRKLAGDLESMKRRYDDLTVRSRTYRDREHPSERAEEEIRRILGDLEAERKRVQEELEAARGRRGDMESRYKKKVGEIGAAAGALLGREVELTS